MNDPEHRHRSKLLWPVALWGICVAGFGLLAWTAFTTGRHDIEIVEVAGTGIAGIAAGTCTAVATRRTAEIFEAASKFFCAAIQARPAFGEAGGRRDDRPQGDVAPGPPEPRRLKASDSGFHYALGCNPEADEGTKPLATVHPMSPRRRRVS